MPDPKRPHSSVASNFQADADRLFVRSAARAIHVLSAFHEADGPLSLSDIATKAEIDRSAAQRLVHTLMTLGHIRRSPDDRGYLPGLRLLDHTHDTLRLDPVVQVATPVILEMRKSITERIDFSLYDETRVIYALRMQSKRETFYATLVGHSVPTYCTAGGRATLCALPPEEAREIINRFALHSYTSYTNVDPDSIMNSLEQARRDGFAQVQNEFVLGEVAIGVPVVNRQGRPLGAIHIAGSLSEWSAEDFARRAAPIAQEAARAISGSF